MFLQIEVYIKSHAAVCFMLDGSSRNLRALYFLSVHRIHCHPHNALRSAPRPQRYWQQDKPRVSASVTQMRFKLRCQRFGKSRKDRYTLIIFDIWLRCIHNSHKNPCILTSIFSMSVPLSSWGSPAFWKPKQDLKLDSRIVKHSLESVTMFLFQHLTSWDS